MKTKLFLIVALSVFLSIPAYAAQLVVNGNFSTGDFTGWNVAETYVPNSCLVVVDIYGGDNPTATWSGWGINDREGVYDTISQTLSTRPGHRYNIRFDLTHLVDPGNFRVSWDGTEILSLINPPEMSDSYHFNLRASGNSTILAFSGYETEGLWLLDNVRVNGPAGPSAPIPGSALLLGSGLLAFVGLRKLQ